MKILVLASLTPPATANYFIRALRKGGHDLLVCSDVPSPLADLLVRGATDVAEISARQNFAPELVLFVEGGTMRLLPVGLENMACVTAWYGIDTHMDYAKHLRVGRLFDVTFIAQQEFVERLRQDGLRQVHWLPLGFASELMPVPMPPKSLDIAHVGSSNVSVNPLRHALISVLRREFPSSYFGPASPQEMGRIYAGTKIVFNRSVNNDVNMRFFEAAGAGAVLVTDPIIDNGVEALFEENVHYVVYRDEASLLKLVRTLLAEPARCESIGGAARQRVLERHTYQHRADALLVDIALADKVAEPDPESYFAALLALDMLGPSLGAAARAMAATSGGTYRKIAGGLAAAVLRVLGGMLDLLERMRKH